MTSLNFASSAEERGKHEELLSRRCEDLKMPAAAAYHTNNAHWIRQDKKIRTAGGRLVNSTVTFLEKGTPGKTVSVHDQDKANGKEVVTGPMLAEQERFTHAQKFNEELVEEQAMFTNRSMMDT